MATNHMNEFGGFPSMAALSPQHMVSPEREVGALEMMAVPRRSIPLRVWVLPALSHLRSHSFTERETKKTPVMVQ